MIMKRGVSIFLIIIIVFSIFSIYNSDNVYAQSKVCCEKTVDGEYCQFSDKTLCDLRSRSVSASCEQTSYCKLGSCFVEDEGRCFKNVPQSSCTARKGIYFDEPNCNIPQAQQGCCLLGNDAFFTTLGRCNIITSQYPDVKMSFDESITDESQCLEKSRSQEKGACVKEDGTCLFTSRESCNTAGLEAEDSRLEKINQTSVGFHKDFLCSNPLLGTECARQQTTRCSDGKVYWTDSCGNIENVYDSNKERSYNNGFILSQPSCDANPNDPNCGNCDYGLGSLCGKAPREVKPAFGDLICKSVDCKTTTKENPVSPNAGTPKKNGESWCVYDAATGFGRDVVGSRQFRRLCVGGEEITEPCRDFREEICVQGILGQDPFGTEASFGLSAREGNFVEARCRVNRNNGCIAIENKNDCENIAFGDCFWLATGIKTDGNTGICLSTVPKGLKFWSDITPAEGQILGQDVAANVAAQRQRTPNAEATSVCSQGNRGCEITYKTGGVARITGLSFGFSDKDECVNNCHCEDKSWVIAAHNTCVALGDCGAYYNIAGVFTNDGFSSIGGSINKINANDVGKWNQGTLSTTEYKKPGHLNEITDNKGLIISLAAVGLTGLVGISEGAGFFKGLTSGTLGALGAGAVATGGALTSFLGLTGKDILGGKGATVSETFGQGLKTYGSKLASEATLTPGTVINAGKESMKISYTKIIDTRGSYNIPEGANSIYLNGDLLTLAPNTKLTLAEGSRLQYSFTENIAAEKSFTIAKDTVIHKVEGTTATVNQASLTGQIWGIINVAAITWSVLQLADVLFAKTKTKNVQVTCDAWRAPEGGSDCRQCGKDGKGCSEYRCKSLGQNCVLINEGTGKEECINLHPNDVNSPIITPAKELITKGLTIKELNEKGIKGFQINERIEAFKPINLGIKTNEPAQCKYDSNNSVKFNDMNNFFGDTLYESNHTLMLRLPGELAEPEAIKLTNGGTHNLYVRCKDRSGNANEKDYMIRFRIQPGPDLTPPIIERTSIQNGAFVPQGINETDLSIYVNEPSSCKWSNKDTDYEVMENTFQCATTGIEQDLGVFGLYRCNTELKGINFGENKFYFRCKDQPTKQENQRNVNEESLLFTLSGTNELNIVEAGPSGTLYDIPILRVVTSGGAENGKSICAFSEEDAGFEAMTQFFNSDSTINTQELILDKGNYNFFVKCRDKAGNEDFTQIKFRLDIDVSGPRVALLYKDSSASLLHLETTENSICEYSNNGAFKFGEGTLMTGQEKAHEASLVNERYHIICRDSKNNEVKFVVIP
ncbi:hypothetical protein HYX17_00080 [Candidatus Woesearchaeota archaeon]|nr:hypothetical protein [Candidatus Woesearchaeota archaeon]